MTESSHLTAAGTAALPASCSRPDPLAADLQGGAKIRFDSIDGLRGIACLMVVYFHSWLAFGAPRWVQVSAHGHHFGLANVLARGYGGVDLFFVLSGFCLAFPIVSKPNRRTDWKRYFIARCRRILPPYWASLIFLAALGFAIRHLRIHALMNIPPATPHGPDTVLRSALLIQLIWNGSFWTLLVEWRWYFLFPLLIWVWRRWRGPGVFAITVAAAAFYLGFMANRDLPRIKYWMTRDMLKYLPMFGGGIWAAQMTASAGARTWLERQLVRVAPLGALGGLISIFCFPPVGPNTLLQLLTWGPFSFFTVLAAVNHRHVCKALCFKPLVTVGIFSYSLYVTHEQIGTIAGKLLLPHASSRLLVLLLHMVAVPAIMVGFGYVFFLVAERPWLTKRQVIRTSAPAQVTSETVAIPSRLPEAAAST